MSAVDERRTVRLFFALWPDPTLRSRLVEVGRELARTVAGKWVPPGNLHLTLAFLGELAAERLPELGRIAVNLDGPGFTLTLDRLEFWPRNGILCLAPESPPERLGRLAENLADSLQTAGFELENRPYRAHLTLARQSRSLLDSIKLADPVIWRVNAFSLMESRPSREGPVYLLLDSWPLQDEGRPDSA